MTTVETNLCYTHPEWQFAYMHSHSKHHVARVAGVLGAQVPDGELTPGTRSEDAECDQLNAIDCFRRVKRLAFAASQLTLRETMVGLSASLSAVPWERGPRPTPDLARALLYWKSLATVTQEDLNLGPSKQYPLKPELWCDLPTQGPLMSGLLAKPRDFVWTLANACAEEQRRIVETWPDRCSDSMDHAAESLYDYYQPEACPSKPGSQADAGSPWTVLWTGQTRIEFDKAKSDHDPSWLAEQITLRADLTVLDWEIPEASKTFTRADAEAIMKRKQEVRA